ncbi:MAG TPA: helix-turn-helix domain-containing protein [Polyangiales bacterium]
MDAAFELYCLVGIRRTSMEDVAKRANMGRASVYRKFEGSDKLVSALLQRETRRAIAKVEAAVQGVDDVEERFIIGFVTGIRAVRKHPLLLTLIAMEPERALPMLTTRAGGGLAFARAFLARETRRAQKTLGLPTHNAEHIAEILARLTHSLVLTPETGLPLDDDKKIRDFARRHIVPMVTGKVSPR